MALTRNFKTTVMARAKCDKNFCTAMLSEAINELLFGDLEVGKAILRDYINASISFEVLSKATDKDPKSLMRMLSIHGNPTSKSLFMMLQAIQKLKKLNFNVSVH